MPSGIYVPNAVAYPAKMEGTDYSLIARYIAGNDLAFAEIVSRYTPQLRAHLGRLLWQLEPDVRSATIEDILQEVWLRVMRFATRLNPQHKFATWLYTVATNLARNEHRNKARRAVRMPLQANSETGAFEELIAADTTAQSRPDVVCEDRDMLKKLAQYLRQHCSVKYLTVLELREVLGYSYNEIAAHLGISVGTVKSRMHRARKVARQFRDANK